MANSSIEWTQATWNPTTGCSKISPGCKYCYAERMSRRLLAMGVEKYANGFKPTQHNTVLDLPLTWKTPKLIFVDSMSDLFHDKINYQFINKVIEVMGKAYWHQFQVLTKRSDRLIELDSKIIWPRNVWLGVSVESEDYKFRINHLAKTKAHIKFLSLEPLIGPIPNLNLKYIDWVIVGGESGPGARQIQEEWVKDIRNQCKRTKTPFFFKQWGGVNRKKTGRELQGKIWDEMPQSIYTNKLWAKTKKANWEI
jgi:protein gp37